MYKIILSDNTVIENLELNGNNFVSKELIDSSIFENNISKVTIIEDDQEPIIYENMKLVQNVVYGDESWFILLEKSKEEIEKEISENTINNLKAEVDYQSMIIEYQENSIEQQKADIDYLTMITEGGM